MPVMVGENVQETSLLEVMPYEEDPAHPDLEVSRVLFGTTHI